MGRWVVFALMCSSVMSFAAETPVTEEEQPSSVLPDAGPFSFSLGLTSIYQQNMRGGLSTNDRRGRFSGSYDVEMMTDLKRLFEIDNAQLYTHVEGFWNKTEGIDSVSTGSAFGVNGDAMPRDAAVVTELWYQHSFLDGDFIVRMGKMDLSGGFECSGCPVSFDCNRYANDETSQFLNSALVNNPTIPFPDYTLGVAMHYAPADAGWYITAAAADSQGDHRETGFRTAFHDEDYYVYMAETGITPSFGHLQGTYSVGVWHMPEPTDVDGDGISSRNNTGMYLSFDQMLSKENEDADDSQGLGTFFRFGYAPSTHNAMTQFYSTGLSYQGLFDGRDDDVLAFGVARGYFSEAAGATYTEDSETVFETFYNIAVNSSLTITPSIQYVADPSSADNGRDLKDAVVFGLRMQMVF